MTSPPVPKAPVPTVDAAFALEVAGRIVPGHGVASGRGNTPYPAGSIAMQRPFFAARGLDLGDCHDGTINVSIAPRRWRLTAPAWRFEHVEWTSLHPPETFSFAPCRIACGGHAVGGWIYQPDPLTKRTHFHDDALIEVLAPWLPGIAPGVTVSLQVDRRHIDILDGSSCA